MTTLSSPIASAKPSDLVFVSQTNELVTDTFHVSQYFGKPHKDVLTKVRSLECSQKFTERNFSLCHKNNELQNGKLQPFYQMTKNGFMFLVMGFTGKRAAEIKERYILAFDEMAAKLRHRHTTPVLPDLTLNAVLSDLPFGTRYLLYVNEEGATIRHIDITKKGLADIGAIRNIQRDVSLVSSALIELKHRMMALSGEYSLEELNEPIF